MPAKIILQGAFATTIEPMERQQKSAGCLELLRFFGLALLLALYRVNKLLFPDRKLQIFSGAFFTASSSLLDLPVYQGPAPLPGYSLSGNDWPG